jgi:hypothetical protein
MEFVLILLAIFWIIIPMAAKNSQKKAKAEAERQRALRQQAPQTQQAQQNAPQAMRTAPLTPSMHTPIRASFEGTGSVEGISGYSSEGAAGQKRSLDLSGAQSTLTQLQVSSTRTITASSESGHAHEETSLTGILTDCPPDKMPAKPSMPIASTSSESVFLWDVEAARSGLVMAEILGPCLAIRD